MFKFFLKLYVLSLVLLLNNCTGDNAYNGSDLIGSDYAPTQTQEDVLRSLQTNVFVAHSKAFVSALEETSNHIVVLEDNASTASITSLKSDFKKVMIEWKSVEASYVAVDFNDDLIDTPQFIDYFHTGKNLDVSDDIIVALAQSGNIADYMYKNSSKSITALEYLIFGSDPFNTRKKEALSLVIENLITHAKHIADFYAQDTQFISNVEDASNSLVNVLVDSAFKLKEWRIGEPSGIAQKYKDNPDASRFEYEKSQYSLEAIKTILLTHQEIMAVQTYSNFGDFASDNGASSVVTSIRDELANAISIVDSFDTPIEESVSSVTVDTKVKNLYNSIDTLQTLYFESLISSLNLTAEIIEADGD